MAVKTIEHRNSKRVHFSLIPDLFDRIDVSYPDTSTEIYTYSLTDNTGVYQVQGIVEVKYTDANKTSITYVKRT